MIDKGQWREFSQDTGLHPYSFTMSVMGFLMTTESHWIYLIHEFHNLSWITEINELFHDILIYWDAPVYAIAIYEDAMIQRGWGTPP